MVLPCSFVPKRIACCSGLGAGNACEDRLKPGGKYEMATLELSENVSVNPATVRRLTTEAGALNATLGNPAKAGTRMSPYAGPKGNLKFPLDHPIPYKLIERIVKRRVRQNLAKTASKRRKKA